MNMTSNSVKALTIQWFEQVVLGLNLCPFAHRPARKQQIRFQVSQSQNEEELMSELITAIEWLARTPPETCETTLLIAPNLLQDFYDYQFFLEEAHRLLKREQWLDIFQLASFHPNYCFAGYAANDPSNLTNRSPYPIIHILREDSLSETLKNVDHPEDIPESNINTMRELNEQEKQQLFPYLALSPSQQIDTKES